MPVTHQSNRIHTTRPGLSGPVLPPPGVVELRTNCCYLLVRFLLSPSGLFHFNHAARARLLAACFSRSSRDSRVLAGSPPVRVVAAPFPGTVSALVVQAAMWNLKGFSLYLLLFLVKEMELGALL